MSDSSSFYRQPILNSPYKEPTRHWEMDENHQPTKKIIESRRKADFITPVPRPRNRRQQQGELIVDRDLDRLSQEKQDYHKAIINDIRREVGTWRKLPMDEWKVTQTTATLLKWWRNHQFRDIKPFFCQLEAVDTAIWLAEVAPQYPKKYKEILEYLDNANNEHNASLPRLALKMATGSGKTTVMAMLIAWQTLNHIRNTRKSAKFTSGFLIVTPGITIKDRLQVLKPNYPGNYYKDRELVPQEMLGDIRKATVVITNYHAFMLRENKIDASANTRKVLQGWRADYGIGHEPPNIESEGEMILRVMPELARLKNIVVINDEAHHCYRENPGEIFDEDKKNLKGSDKDEAVERQETARVWISGLEAVRRQLGISKIYDLSATPFFLAGSGYAEGTIFPWTMSDFSLMDAIECGIVKLPRIPVSDNIPDGDVPVYLNLWERIRTKMPKKNSKYDPQSFPAPLITALQALYSHYEKTFELWLKARLSVPPCFIIVCNNTNTSKQIYDYISGYWHKAQDGKNLYQAGACALFNNYEDNGTPLARPRTLLIDSAQLERDDVLDKEFEEVAKEEIDRFRRQAILRGGKLAAEIHKTKKIPAAALLREVMNTVGKKGQLGEGIRCVVSVGMLSEGWDANNVTHILGVRAFGTQLLCEQVIGRALRRQCYDMNEQGLFEVEYADALGIPFDFSARPDITPPPTPRETTHIMAISPDRDALEINFPRVAGYRTVLPGDILRAEFTEDSKLLLTLEMVGPTETENAGIIGQAADLNIENMAEIRDKTVLMYLTKYLLEGHFRDGDGQPKLYLYGQLKKIASDWMRDYFECAASTYPAQLLYKTFADLACERIVHAINKYNINHTRDKNRVIQVFLDPYNPCGTTMDVNFKTTKRDLYVTDESKCHINYVVSDSGWEEAFARILEKPDKPVVSYVKNHNLGFTVPYRFAGENHTYIPDFIVRISDGNDEPLNLIVEIKGIHGEDAKQKRLTMETMWVPGVNSLGEYGRWDFIELRDKNCLESDFDKAVARIRQGLPAADKENMGDLFNG